MAQTATAAPVGANGNRAVIADRVVMDFEITFQAGDTYDGAIALTGAFSDFGIASADRVTVNYFFATGHAGFRPGAMASSQVAWEWDKDDQELLGRCMDNSGANVFAPPANAAVLTDAQIGVTVWSRSPHQ